MRTIMKSSLFVFTSLCLVSLAACGKDAEARKIEEPVPQGEVARKLPRLLDFGAKKCLPCKTMAPILGELTKDYQGVFEVEFIDVCQSENREKAKAHGIRSIPTQIFFDATGKELWRHEGFFSKEEILKKWTELGFSFKPVPQEKSLAKPAVSESE